jgi:hypothetical protein
MTVPAPIAAAVRTFLRAQLTGDLAALTSVCRPCPELALLAPSKPPVAAVAPMLAELDRLQLSGTELPADRWLARAFLGGVVHVLLLHDAPAGPRVDARYALAACKPDDERRRVARAFYRALLLGDATTLLELAFDARGIELLLDGAPPAGEHAQLEHVAASMGLVQLDVGEPFTVPNGVEFVTARHAEMGIDVFSALAPDAEFPLLLRKRDGAWKVIVWHFVQAAALARGGTIVS